MPNINRIEDYRLKDRHGRVTVDPSNMQIAGSMLYTTFVRKARPLLLSLMITLIPLVDAQVVLAQIIFVILLMLYMVITTHRIVNARHEFAHVARRIDKISRRAIVAIIYSVTGPLLAYYFTVFIIIPNTIKASDDVPAWSMCVALLLISVANFITSILDDLIDGGITDLYDEDEDDSALAEHSVDSPAEDLVTRPVESATTTTALIGFIVGYICGRFNR